LLKKSLTDSGTSPSVSGKYPRCRNDFNKDRDAVTVVVAAVSKCEIELVWSQLERLGKLFLEIR
jgi:hypothetical protein